MYKTADHVINKCRPINTNINCWREVEITAGGVSGSANKEEEKVERHQNRVPNRAL